MWSNKKITKKMYNCSGRKVLKQKDIAYLNIIHIFSTNMYIFLS